MALLWLNGAFVPEDDASISLRDTGLLHAAGVFTTLRAQNGKIFRLDAHLARLRRSCEVLFIPLQYRDAQLRKSLEELLQRNVLTESRLRLTVTRGQARQDPLHGLSLRPNVFATAAPLEPYPQEFYDRGMTVLVLDEQKLNPYDIQAGHKTLNYFSRLAALRDANQRSAGEALWFNVHNYLQSGSISNVFVIKDGVIRTPPTAEELRDPQTAASVPYPKSAVLPGITRQTVLELAGREGVAAEPAALTINHLLQADEVFLTNSIMGVMPVCRIERHAIGEDRPGHITRRLAELFQDEVNAAI